MRAKWPALARVQAPQTIRSSLCDGKFISYLNHDTENKYDPVVFEVLKKIAPNENKNVQMIEAQNLIPDAVYFDELLNTEKI